MLTKSLLRVGGTRAVSLVVSGFAALALSRLMIVSLGPEPFGVVSYLVGLAAFSSFFAFGAGVAATNSGLGRFGSNTQSQVLLSAYRRTILGGLILFGLGAVVTGFGLWDSLLGLSEDSLDGLGRAMAILTCVLAISVPAALGNSTLIGEGRNATAIFFQSLGPVFSLLFVWLSQVSNLPQYLVPGMLASGPVAASMLATSVAFRIIRLGLGRFAGQLVNWRRWVGAPIMSQALPGIAFSLLLPIVFQSGRFFVAQAGLSDQLDQYSLGQQLYGFFAAMISAMGMVLWPYFGKRLTVNRRELALVYAAFTGIGAIASVAYFFAAQPASEFISANSVTISASMLTAFAVLIFVESMYWPGGMIMTDKGGLQIQAALAAITCAVYLSCVIPLTSQLGASGPVWAMAISVFSIRVLVLSPIAFARRPSEDSTS